MTFNLSENDWRLANDALAGKESGTKYDKFDIDAVGSKLRNQSARPHSFIIIEGVIYALSNRQTYIPAFGKRCVVKKGMTAEGKIVGIRIENSELKDTTTNAHRASVINKLFIAQGLRRALRFMRITVGPRENPKAIIVTQKKLYTVMEWRGECLFDIVMRNLDKFTDTQKQLLSLRLCLLIKSLHAEGIVHGDLKTENITGKVEGLDIELYAVDFDFSKILNQGQDHVKGKPRGTPGYLSPEVAFESRWSYSSDMYALGIMLLFMSDVTCTNMTVFYRMYIDEVCKKEIRVQLEDPLPWLNLRTIEPELKGILKGMLTYDHSERTNSTAMIIYLCTQLLNNRDIQGDLRTEILAIKLEHLELTFEKKTDDVLLRSSDSGLTYLPSCANSTNDDLPVAAPIVSSKDQKGCVL